jgi:hypothetical protein
VNSSLSKVTDDVDTPRLSIVRGPSPVVTAVLDRAAHLFQEGREWAIRAMVLVARPEDTEALSGIAKAHARATQTDDYDPATIAADRHRADIFERDRAESRRLSEAMRNAATTAHEAGKDAAAKQALVGDPPATPLVMMITTAAVVAMTIAPSIHDFIFATLRDDLNWAISLSLGLVIGGMLVWGLIAEGSNVLISPRAALYGGIVIGIGFAVLRLSAAEDLGEVVYALGLSAIEIGTLVFADAIGVRHRAELAGWQERKAGAGDAAARAESGRNMYEQLRGQKEAVDQAVQDHLRYADERRELSRDLPGRETAYTQAILAGYGRGIAENVGRAQGYGHGA